MPRSKRRNIILTLIKNPFIWTLLYFFVHITFIEEYNLIRKSKDRAKLNQLKEAQQYYKNKIKTDRAKLRSLTSSKASLEKYAREQYLMKKEGEDIFIVIEK
ncbi:septum formation inhibitor [Prolixibacteraceae bacterium JC049]|nr:septum formation inhibitor [Prolixibacteraceae bacterium JC049]